MTIYKRHGPRTMDMNKSKIFFLAVLIFAWSIPGTALAAEKHPMIRFFQDHISPADGDRCPMTPSCSAYAARAAEKHGIVMGWIMACDRLVRCGRNETGISPHVRINGRDYTSDPVKNNDFWWFKPKETNK